MAASMIWQVLGNPGNYVEPFAGSLAVLLARPDEHAWWDRIETVNDKDGFICNLWRAIQHAPEAVATWADGPINENDLHARHAWLVARTEDLQARLEGDPTFYDAQVAGWWLWGICSWIGSGWCSGEGPWRVEEGQLTHLGNAGQGIHRQLTHLGNAGRGIHRQLTHLGNAGQGQCAAWLAHLQEMMGGLADRLRRVRVCSGDWSRVCGPSPTTKLGLTGICFDPPYQLEDREADLYRVDDDVWAAVRAWCLAHGDDPLLRIVLCGYANEQSQMPASWTMVPWKARGGYGSQGQGRGRANCAREVLYCSPHCLKPIDELPLFAEEPSHA